MSGTDHAAQTPAPRRYLPAERQDAILTLLTRRPVVKIPELAQALNTTEITIRRDLAQLADAGLLQRVRGGARSLGATEQESAAAGAVAGRVAPAAAGGAAGGTIGVLFPEPSFLWPHVVDVISRTAQEEGLRIVSRESTYEGDTEIALLDELASMDGMLGLITAPTTNPRFAGSVWRWLDQAPVPTVVVERTQPLSTDFFIDSSLTDHAHGARKAYWHFARHGHTRVGAAFSDTPTSSLIERGWRLIVDEESRIACPFVRTGLQPYDTAGIEEVVESIVSTGVTGMFVHSDYLAIALVQALERHGKQVPDDISLISVDGFTALSPRRLTVLRSSPAALGGAAIRMLLWRLSNPQGLTQHMTFDPELVDRGSVIDVR